MELNLLGEKDINKINALMILYLKKLKCSVERFYHKAKEGNKALGKLQGPSFEQVPVSSGSCWES